jgi:hypothetical protein
MLGKIVRAELYPSRDEAVAAAPGYASSDE